MIVPLATVKSSRLRTLVEGAVLSLVAIATLQTWLLDGLFMPYQLSGSSMATALLGVHRDVVCGNCGYRFSCGTDLSPAPRRAVCPNCGYPDNDLESLPERGGDYVLMDRAAFAVRPPRRWEVVAFRRASQAERIAVKRVVGLPGETIDIRHGDVYADGRLLRKNLLEQRALAVLVHDAAFPPRPEMAVPPRWRAERPQSGWRAAGGDFAHATSGNRAVEWIEYHHGRDSPVTDLCAYNPSQPRREEDVHAVADLMVSLRLAKLSGSGAFCVRMRDGHDEFETRLEFDQSRPCYRVLRNGRPLPGGTGDLVRQYTAWHALNNKGRGWPRKCTTHAPDGRAGGGLRLVEMSLVDQQLLLAFDGETLLAWPYQRPDPPPTPPACPLALGAEGLEVTVGDLRVYRDVYYTDPAGLHGHRRGNRPVRLGAGQYYVLGDNSPVSEDSRHWTGGEVDAKLLVGKPLAAIPPLRLSLAGGGLFQVPNPLRIRYIW
jgi:signal peptidase I